MVWKHVVKHATKSVSLTTRLLVLLRDVQSAQQLLFPGSEPWH